MKNNVYTIIKNSFINLNWKFINLSDKAQLDITYCKSNTTQRIKKKDETGLTSGSRFFNKL